MPHPWSVVCKLRRYQSRSAWPLTESRRLHPFFAEERQALRLPTQVLHGQSCLASLVLPPELLIPYLIERSLAKWGLSTVTDRNASSLNMDGSSSVSLRTPRAGGAAFIRSSPPVHSGPGFLPASPTPLGCHPVPEDALSRQVLCLWACGQPLMLGFCSPTRGCFWVHGF